jgi:hypothetical protein
MKISSQAAFHPRRLCCPCREAQEWNKGQLDQWAAVAGQREDDNLALHQYQRQDEVHIKQLNRDLERWVWGVGG